MTLLSVNLAGMTKSKMTAPHLRSCRRVTTASVWRSLSGAGIAAVKRSRPGAHSGTIQTNLFLFSRFEWKLCQLFTAIGQRRHGEAIRMNWSLVPGAIGTCHVGTRKWMGNDGKEHEGNEITEFYDPEEAPDISEKQVDSQPAPGQGAEAAASWDAGRF